MTGVLVRWEETHTRAHVSTKAKERCHTCNQTNTKNCGHRQTWAHAWHRCSLPAPGKDCPDSSLTLTSRTVKADGDCLSPPQWQFLCFALRSLLPGSPFVIIMPTARVISVRQRTFWSYHSYIFALQRFSHWLHFKNKVSSCSLSSHHSTHAPSSLL